ncbi:hypothetical protein K1T71_013499 [Dendrolimus kikuchii]|uniref:Uncharacterized protein n=1 Tax=Dendrolimus kikuchii TaxID=765133 RepID=A0ACC1CGW3_9NEOP|nr:hypothetical protein K1T71_013499 [Dendrolimus kikuchii]
MEKGLKYDVSNEDEKLHDSIIKTNYTVVNGHSSTNVNNDYTINKDLNKDTILKKDREDNDDIEIFNHDNFYSPEEFSRCLTDTTPQAKSNKDVLAVKSFCHKLIYLRKQIFISCCLYTGFMLDGYSVGWCAPVVVKLQDPAETPLPYIISDTAGSWLGSVLYIGLFGGYLAGFLANIIGRKPCLIIGGILMMSAYLTLTFATNITTMYFARFFAGFTESFSVILRLLYVGEISSPEIRGTLISLVGVFHNIGALTVYSIGPFTSYRNLNYFLEEEKGGHHCQIISTSGVGICMTIMGTYFYLDKYHNSVTSQLGWLPLATMIIALISFNIGLNSVPHTLTSEMYSPKVRGIGTSISYTSSLLSGLFSLIVSSYLMIYLGSHFTFWLFAILNGASLIFVVLFVPETTGKTLTEIDDMMGD